jgi:hypothetical protein
MQWPKTPFRRSYSPRPHYAISFHLPLKALQVFLRSLVMILSADLPIPSYTQICQRAKLLDQKLKKHSRKNITLLLAIQPD